MGTFGDFASYRLQNSKHISTGEGGVAITNSEEYADNIRRLSSLGYANVSAKKGKITKTEIQNPNFNRHSTLGWNYRMSELCAAVALGQLENLEYLVDVRKNVAEIYHQSIKGFEEILTPQFLHL